MKSLLLKVSAIVLIATASGMSQEPGEEQLDQRQNPTLEFLRFDFTGGGARAEGMGKAFIGLSDDNTAGAWNPAGLYELEDPIISLSYGTLLARGETESGMKIPGDDPALDHDASINSLSSANFVAPLRLKGHPFVGSVSYTRNFNDYQASDLSYTFDLEYTPLPGVDTSALARVDYMTDLKGGMNSVNFGLGTRIYGDVSAGVVLNVYTGTMVREQVIDQRINNLLDNFLQEYDSRYTGTVLDSNSFSGYNVTLGFKYNKENLGVGLLIRTPFDLSVETDRSIYEVNRQNELPIDAGSDTTYFDDLLAKYEIPWMVGVGAAYHLNEKTIITADAEFRAWDGRKVNMRDSVFLDPGSDNEEFFTEVDPQWRNVFIIRAGAETMIGGPFSSSMPLRAGLGYVPIPAPSIDMSENLSTTTSTKLAAGSGLWWEQIHFDVAYTFTRMDWERGSITQKTRDHHVSATFTGYF